jgi:hypothetical protein
MVQMPVSEVMMSYYFGYDPPSVWEAEKNISLVMVNNHWSQSYTLPLMPSIIQLGSIHIQEQSKPLPEVSSQDRSFSCCLVLLITHDHTLYSTFPFSCLATLSTVLMRWRLCIPPRPYFTP